MLLTRWLNTEALCMHRCSEMLPEWHVGSNMTGSLPASMFESLVDLQELYIIDQRGACMTFWHLHGYLQLIHQVQ